tara:strand:+ start:509 stop:862 length:354 start_codon:yes stop_codon:yes gene_type:complete
MLLQDPNLQVWLYAHDTDMRCGIDGLASIAQSRLHLSANSGALFVFINRRRTMIKILYYSHGGYCLWCKRLERGRFQKVAGEGERRGLTWGQLHCLIDGINWQKMRRNKRLTTDFPL